MSVSSSGMFAGFFRRFAQGFAVEPARRCASAHEGVEDGISVLSYPRSPGASDRRAAHGYDCSAAAVAIVDDFAQVAALLRGQRRQPPVVEDQKLDTGEALEEECIPAIAACQRQCVEQAWHAMVEHRSIVTACLVSECKVSQLLPVPVLPVIRRSCRLPIQSPVASLANSALLPPGADQAQLQPCRRAIARCWPWACWAVWMRAPSSSSPGSIVGHHPFASGHAAAAQAHQGRGARVSSTVASHVLAIATKLGAN